ncbi:ABC transporter substrate-binding protein [Ideonella livida]|uniref:ABC transporter substrate-binding protein n=1 Tax=Ideonella livida TaxID=2707176 RepID=A0A7C9TMM0_9BURK|nr:ABC transporter substrate-binding protein [Ideonella livida]NDY92725.1 ABC transporter substrate-binding protein [Ideonella livida]
MNRRDWLGQCSVGGVAWAFGAGARAANGVVRLGQSASLSGGQARYGKDVQLGLRAALHHVNSQAKARGLSFELITLDDGGKRDKVQANVQELLDRGVEALVGLTSGAGAESVLHAVTAAGVPLVGVASGNMGIRQGVRGVFHVRAGYDVEYRRMLTYLTTYGLKRVALVNLRDTSGANARAMTEALAQERIEPVVQVALDRNTQDFAAPAAQVLAAKPDAVVFTTNAAPVLAMVQRLDLAGFRGLVLSSSFAGQEVVEGIAAMRRTFILSTVVPRPTRLQHAVVKHCIEDLQAIDPQARVGLTVLEGYITGRVTAAAALAAAPRAGAVPSRQALAEALHGLRLDLGGHVVDYTQGRHGSDFVDIVSVDREGRMIG